MGSDQIIALIGACVLAFIVRIFNVVVEWLSRVLGVEAPEPIPTHHTAATTPVEARPVPTPTDPPSVPPAST